MISARYGSDMDQAFVRLRNHARNHSVQLGQLAQDLISGARSVSPLDRT
jgi:ANTAR domain-containing protein